MRKLLTQTKDAMRAIPGIVTAVFILSVVSMNLLANKSVFNAPWLAATAGIFMSWISFLCMDAVCKRFGAKAATILNTIAMLISLGVTVLYMLIVKIPGVWPQWLLRELEMLGARGTHLSKVGLAYQQSLMMHKEDYASA